MNKKVFAWMLALLVSTVIFAQDRTVMGKVTDEVTGSEIPGVTVLIKGTTSGTTTNLDGVYQLKVSDGSTLIFSFSGYEAQEIVLGARSVVDVTMMEYVGQLGEVVVTAFGIERGKKALGYAVTQVEGDQFVNSRPVNLGNALAGKVAGVNVSAPSTGAAGSSRVTIRGSASLSGNDQPLYVINGVPIDNSTLGSAGLWGGNDGGDGLNSLNPDDIESISVLKGNSAAALYGARAANGVILITTKSGKSINGIEVSFNSNLTFDNVIDRTDWQKEYGTGSEGIAPTDINSALEFGGTSWGAKLDGSEVVQFDGEARAYSNMGEGLNDFYRTGQTWTNTLALAGGDENGGFRFSAPISTIRTLCRTLDLRSSHLMCPSTETLIISWN